MLKHSLRLAALLAPLAPGGIAHAAPEISAPVAITDAAGRALFPPTRIEYNALAQQTRENLQSQVLAKWFPAALNRERGGFDQNFGADWTKLPGDERSLVYQARLTWTAAQAAMRLPAEEFIYRNHARHGLQFLRDAMWDGRDGGFYWQIENGAPLRNGEKHVYGQALAISALSAAYRATRDPDALRLAQQTFLWLDKHAHDDQNGGYFEALRRDGTPIMAPYAEGKLDFTGTRYGFKSMNAHVHLLEAYGALYQVWPGAALKTRLSELFDLVLDKIIVEPGALNRYFTPDWRAIPAADSYGHDLETAYLLTETARVLGREGDALARRAARSLVDHALEVGFDAERGGVYRQGSAWGDIADSDKTGWAQAESLNALLAMHELYGGGANADRRYWDAFIKQWNWVRRYQVDAVNGGWYSSVKADGTPPPAEPA